MRSRALAFGFADKIGQVLIPTEEVVELRGPDLLPDRQAQKNQEAVLLRRALAANNGAAR